MLENKKRISIITLFYLIVILIIFVYMGVSLYKAILKGKDIRIQNSQKDKYSYDVVASSSLDKTLKVEELKYYKEDYVYYSKYSDSNIKFNLDNKVDNKVDLIELSNGNSGDFWSDGSTWYSNMVKENKDANSSMTASIDPIIKIFVDMINVIGTTVIAFVTIFLGIKYIFGSVDNKVSVKESLVNLLVACVFFFGWSSIRNLLISSNNEFILFSDTSSYKNILGDLFSLFTYVANGLAVLAVVYIGVRYIVSGAPGRADLKSKSPQFILGIIMAFCASSFLTFVSKVITEVL